MAYLEEGILSCLPGGTVPANITAEVITGDDIGGSWKNVHAFADQSSVPTTGTNPVYFDSTNLRFYTHNGSNWVVVVPTHANVFGTDSNNPRVWLGINDGATGSEQIDSKYEVTQYLSSNYNTANRYFFYNALNAKVTKVTAFTAEYEDETIQIVKNKLDNFYINRAVTFSGNHDNLAQMKVRLARENEEVIGSIIGYSYKRLQIAVEGWDIKFINGTSDTLKVGKRILGKENPARHSTFPWGYVQTPPEATSVYRLTNSDLRRKSRGMITDPGETTYGGNIVRVAMKFGY